MSKLVFEKNNNNNKIVKFNVNNNDKRFANKSEKLKKLSKFKKLIKNMNLYKNNVIKKSSF